MELILLAEMLASKKRAMRGRVCLNVAGRDSRVEVAGAGAGKGRGYG